MGQLTGMKAITAKMNMSAPTIMTWVRDYGFPARKIGGIWICDDMAIDRWRLRFCEGTQDLEEPSDDEKPENPEVEGTPKKKPPGGGIIKRNRRQ